MKNNNYKDKVVKVGTFFSGIGSPEKALEKLKSEGIIKDYSLEFFSEIDKNAIKSYCAVHNVDESLNLGNIIDIKGKDLSYCDLWIGGFPCQDISCAGKMKTTKNTLINKDFNSNDIYDISKGTAKEDELFDYAKIPSYLKISEKSYDDRDSFDISL